MITNAPKSRIPSVGLFTGEHGVQRVLFGLVLLGVTSNGDRNTTSEIVVLTKHSGRRSIIDYLAAVAVIFARVARVRTTINSALSGTINIVQSEPRQFWGVCLGVCVCRLEPAQWPAMKI